MRHRRKSNAADAFVAQRVQQAFFRRTHEHGIFELVDEARRAEPPQDVGRFAVFQTLIVDQIDRAAQLIGQVVDGLVPEIFESPEGGGVTSSGQACHDKQATPDPISRLSSTTNN